MREEVTVEKRGGAVEEFDRGKIVSSLQCALKKGNRRRQEVETLVDGIIRRLMADKKKRITSAQIGDEVLRSLRSFDQLAYVRYLSVHQTFANLNEFHKQLGDLGDNENVI
jgi:transcriptional repressor NrdR